MVVLGNLLLLPENDNYLVRKMTVSPLIRNYFFFTVFSVAESSLKPTFNPLGVGQVFWRFFISFD